MNKNTLMSLIFYLLSFCFLFSMNNWFSFWVAMEMNIISFFIILSNMNSKPEDWMNFFLVQTLTSIMFIFTMIHSCPLINLINPLFNNSLMIIIFMKLGLAPFHNWFLPIALNSKLFLFWSLLTIQKIPYYLILFLYSSMLSLFICSALIINILISTLMNLKQNSIKMIVILSSISQMSWVILSILKIFIWEMFFTCYSILMGFFLKVSEKGKKTKNSSIFMIICFLTMTGFPPFFLFLPKIMILMSILSMSMYMLILPLLMFNLMDIYIYSQIFLTSFMKKLMKWQKHQISPYLLIFTSLFIPLLW